MNVLSEDQTSVKLIPLLLNMNQTLDMTLYLITDYVLDNSTSAKGGIKTKIRMSRKILSEIMTTYFPSLLLLMITYATTFFKPFFFEAALSVNLTTMLVMTTIFISKMENLPSTSDIKMIDCWLILCQLVPFVEVVLLTAIEYLREAVEEEKEELKKDLSNFLNIVPVTKTLESTETRLDLEMEDGIEKGTWTLHRPVSTKSALVTKDMVVGECLLLFMSRCMVIYSNGLYV